MTFVKQNLDKVVYDRIGIQHAVGGPFCNYVGIHKLLFAKYFRILFARKMQTRQESEITKVCFIDVGCSDAPSCSHRLSYPII